jgi:NADPH:quinone reductase
VSVYETLEALDIGRCGDRAFVLPYSVRPRQIWMACERLERAALSGLGPTASVKVRINVNQRFALKDAADAHKALEAREASGSTILTI